MTVATIGLTAAYIIIAILLLSLNLVSFWRWWIKALAILATTVFFAVTYQSINALTGWPTSQKLPVRFNLVSTLVTEPDKRTNNPGGIYLWAEELDSNNVPSGRPRSYQLPYSDALARKVAGAQQKRDKGVDVMGRVDDNDAPSVDEARADIRMGQVREGDQNNAAADSVPFKEDGSRLNFEDLPPIILPDKGPL